MNKIIKVVFIALGICFLTGGMIRYKDKKFPVIELINAEKEKIEEESINRETIVKPEAMDKMHIEPEKAGSIDKETETEYGFGTFPYEEIEPCSVSTYEILKEEYEKIDFSCEFQSGNLKIYDSYKKIYKRLLENEIEFIIPQTGEKYYLKEYKDIIPFREEKEHYNVENYIYYFFDMDENGAPELCITDIYSFISIFKYDSQSEQIILWTSLKSSYYSLLGSRSYGWTPDGVNYGFYRTDESGTEIYSVSFYEREYYDEKTDQGAMAYMVGLPEYADLDEQIRILETMKSQAYMVSGRYYFRITEEQYLELTKDYFETEHTAKENLKRVTYTYDELF